MTDTTQAVQTAERMKLARKLAGMSQEDAARALGVAVKTYARWEKVETQGFLGELSRVAEVFGTTADELLGIEDGDMAGQLAALRSEVAELRALLMDPEALRRAADALIEEER